MKRAKGRRKFRFANFDERRVGLEAGYFSSAVRSEDDLIVYQLEIWCRVPAAFVVVGVGNGGHLR